MFAAVSHVLVTAAVVGLALGLRPSEGALRDVAPRPRPTLISVTGLEFDATADLPALHAARATPAQGRSLLTLGDLYAGLRLDTVAIVIGDGIVIHAAVGELGAGPLVLEDVRVTRGEQLILRASTAQVWRGLLRCHGLAVLRPGGEREATVYDQECALSRLALLAR